MSVSMRRVDAPDIGRLLRPPVEPKILEEAIEIVEDVRSRGEPALRLHSERFGDLREGEPIFHPASELSEAFEQLDPGQRAMLTRVTSRIERFASSQRDSLSNITVVVPGGRAGHRWQPVASAGAYAPGGIHPLPSSVLMTVIPARVAGVEEVWVASPRPTPVTLAAACVAGADGLLAVGGAQAMAALAFGTVSPSCDLVVGPGNKWVTAAKKHLYGEVGIDFLAGPSEIVVIADDGAQPALVAADLLAQAEHDVDALPILICTDSDLADRVDAELGLQVEDLPTADVARQALARGCTVVVDGPVAAVELSDQIAPEHLALHVSEPWSLQEALTSYGSLFVGSSSAEAFADYGAGPNHVLPTGGGARFQSGLSVFTFLRATTWLDLERPGELTEDTAALARLEGLEAHARAALRR